MFRLAVAKFDTGSGLARPTHRRIDFAPRVDRGPHCCSDLHRLMTNPLRRDLPASLVVFLVAVPLSLGIVLASGAPIVEGEVGAEAGGL